jgi:hypothetical protein
VSNNLVCNRDPLFCFCAKNMNAANTAATSTQQFCVECEDTAAVIRCTACDGKPESNAIRVDLIRRRTDIFCALCFTWQHRSGKRTTHKPTTLDGVPLATDATKKSLEGTTEHFVQQLERIAHATTHSEPSPDSQQRAPAAQTVTAQSRTSVDEARADAFAHKCESIPLRLNEEERGLLTLLEAALKVCE